MDYDRNGDGICQCFMQPMPIKKEKDVIPERIGIAKGQKLYDDEYDFDEMNPEIARMFGGM